MDMFVVRGGRRLEGRVAVSGAKNAALPIMAASLAASGPTVLHGVPDLVDVQTLAHLLEALGMRVERDAGGKIFQSEADGIDQAMASSGVDASLADVMTFVHNGLTSAVKKEK